MSDRRIQPPECSIFDLPRLKAETFIADVQYHGQVDSTNNLALSMCSHDGLKLPLLVLTQQQTSGRGRGANQWWSAPGSLTCSLVVHAGHSDLPQKLWPQVSLTTGLAVCEMLKQLLPQHRVGLKWPNDVHLNARKVCGILVEAGPRRSDMLVLGIGLNVNNSLGHAPQELRSTATSIVDETQRQHDLTDVLVELLHQIEFQLTRLVNSDPELPGHWQALCVLRGRSVRVDSGRTSAIGRCQGIDRDGALIVRTEAGLTRLFGGVVRPLDSP